MSDQPHTSIRTVIFRDGERMPMLIDAETGIPMFDPCVFACTHVRPRAASAATIEQVLRGVQFLLHFSRGRGIDLAERFTSGQFFDLHELDELSRSAYVRTRRANSGISGKSDAPLVRSPVASGTAAIRLYYAGAYLQWLGERTAGQVCQTLEERDRYIRLLSQMLDRLRIRTPTAEKQSTRVGLNAQQKLRLLRVTDPSYRDKRVVSDFLRDRNRLIVMWGIGTGLRRGELLGLRIKRLDFRRNMASIVRRADDPDDPRKYQPNTKTRERAIGISDELAFLTHEHIVAHRAKISGARKHDFLFVSETTGRPLSLAGFSKVFRELRARDPLVGERLTSHVLRHTWNEDFSEVADKAGLKPEDERRARNHAMGWSEFSKSADHYLRRRTRRLADDISTRIQQSLVEMRPAKAQHE
ncbi:phage integrase [Caballeronia temeraria]|uniref:Phage integrase n=1 Tax=Caballeronia temeraria TaxID=1777137 RepID=A0A158DUS8_9BURK|nr:tyrosine-type recombinase/integrase [Caballeronia temeraria]SAK98371.1 phage integrase [Caballeronia temeraria]